MLCFRKVPVAKKFLDKREGEVSRFLLNFFCLKVTKITEGEPFSLSLISGIEINWMRGWGEGGIVKICHLNCLVSKCRNTS